MYLCHIRFERLENRVKLTVLFEALLAFHASHWNSGKDLSFLEDLFDEFEDTGIFPSEARILICEAKLHQLYQTNYIYGFYDSIPVQFQVLPRPSTFRDYRLLHNAVALHRAREARRRRRESI